MRAALVAVLTATVVALAACGDDGTGSAPTGDATSASPEAAPGLQVRPVLGPAEGGGEPCDDSGDPELPGNPPVATEALLCDLAGERYRLGPAVTGEDPVAAAEAVELREGWRIQVELAATDRDAVATLAETAASSDSQIALVLDGIVLSAPTVGGTIGGTLQLVGSWSDEQAQDYADRLDP